MTGFLSAALAGVLGYLAGILVERTTEEEFRKENKILTLLLWFVYIASFPISFSIGYGYLLVKHIKNKK